MPALLIVYNERGTRLGQCDAKCYNARHRACHCVCQGVNHGVGLRRAAENTRDFSEFSIAQSALSLWPTAVRVQKSRNLATLAHPVLFPVD